jgi:hypothetical protein
MVTHDNRILELADRIITLEDGRMVADSAETHQPAELLPRSASGGVVAPACILPGCNRLSSLAVIG